MVVFAEMPPTATAATPLGVGHAVRVTQLELSVFVSFCFALSRRRLWTVSVLSNLKIAPD